MSSTDLVRWNRHPTALQPTPGGPDGDGCWSGCARIVDGTQTLFYPGVVGQSEQDRVESVCRATSTDLVTWVKDPAPLIPGPPPGHGMGAHRDSSLCTWTSVRARDSAPTTVSSHAVVV